ncbi:hypothetical protein GE061_003395 [Apolygus lucorum]|uniref:Uncharacterized protein n=1 Tax=Apolygus lucorum TaxID=248454 RepID=A0A8S9X215_APOLU|nr:hypothetical protein GE061_003395 [Apolygus lucorum]
MHDVWQNSQISNWLVDSQEIPLQQHFKHDASVLSLLRLFEFSKGPPEEAHISEALSQEMMNTHAPSVGSTSDHARSYLTS